MTRTLPLCLALLLIPLSAGAADKMTKETFVSGGQTRTYYLLSPAAAKKAAPAPLLVLLHGSGRDGRSLLEKWEPLAEDALKDGGFSPELTEISGHTHWYYDRAADINKKAWAFLRTHALSADPKYQRYPWAR